MPLYLPASSSGQLINFSPAYLRKWRKALAGIEAGTGRAKLMMLGDSTMAGVGAGTGGSGVVGAYTKSIPAKVASYLTKLGLPSELNGIVGDGNIDYNANPTYDPRVALGTGWTRDTAMKALGGNPFAFTGGVAGAYSFTPTASFDSFDVYTVGFSGTGTATANIDGGASLGAVTPASFQNITKTSFTCAAGTHTINIVPALNGDLRLHAIDTYLSTAKKVSVISAGYSSASTVEYSLVANPWNPILALPTFAPDLTVLDLTINDARNATSGATYSARMQTMITAIKAASDLILVTGLPTVGITSDSADQFQSANLALALGNNLPMIDVYGRWQSAAISFADGLYFTDQVHGSAPGYADVGSVIARAILAT